MTHDDVAVGQIVTVLQWYESDEGWQDDNPMTLFFAGGSRNNPKSRQYVGEVFRVLAVSLPFVALARAFTNEVVKMDLRRVELAVVRPEYVEALRKEHKQQKERSKKGYGCTDFYL